MFAKHLSCKVRAGTMEDYSALCHNMTEPAQAVELPDKIDGFWQRTICDKSDKPIAWFGVYPYDWQSVFIVAVFDKDLAALHIKSMLEILKYYSTGFNYPRILTICIEGFKEGETLLKHLGLKRLKGTRFLEENGLYYWWYELKTEL